MSKKTSKEDIFNATCVFVGKIGRAFGFSVKRPLFIIGTGRCGTSLLVRILNSHPRISGYPYEANKIWHPTLYPFESVSVDIPPIEIDPKRFCEASIASWPIEHEDTIRDVFAGFRLITRPSKALFAKSAMISFMIPKILEVFPDAGFLHIYRFGPSVLASYFKKNFGRYSSCISTEKDYQLHCAQYWNDCILEIEEKKRDLSLVTGGRFLEFSYESLCQNPREAVSRVAGWLGVARDGFTFDFSQVTSQNYKVTNFGVNPEWDVLLNLMSPAMKLKGYSKYSLTV